MEGLVELRGERGLVLGIGGGGDSASAALIQLWLRMLGSDASIGGVVWERLPVDPTPGPIRLDELRPVERRGLATGWVSGSTHAIRGGRSFKPQVARVAEVLGEEALAIDLWPGPVEVAESLIEVLDEGYGFIVGVDVGGDVLALGVEDDLWSPLADQVMLAVLARLERRGFKALLAVHGLGVDGELTEAYLLRRLSALASKGGYLGAIGMGRAGADRLRRVVAAVETESSLLPLEAFEGRCGYRALRSSTRGVRLRLTSAITYIVDPLKLYEDSPMAKALSDAKSLDEANLKLNEMGVYTELDLERDLYRVYVERGRVTRGDVLRARREGMARVRGRAP